MNTNTKLISLLIALAVIGLVACGESGPQRVEVTVSASGYSPAEVRVEHGRPITLAFRRVTEEGCGRELVIPSQNIRRPLPLNQTVEVTLPAQEAGRVAFTCGMNMYRGAVVVQ